MGEDKDCIVNAVAHVLSMVCCDHTCGVYCRGAGGRGRDGREGRRDGTGTVRDT